MLNEERNSLCHYRIEKAEACLKGAKLLKDAGDYTSAANRLYVSGAK